MAGNGETWDSEKDLLDEIADLLPEKGLSMTYALIDPTKFGPGPDKWDFPSFVQSIFYVGKGTYERPKQHIKDVLGVPPSDLELCGRKIRRINQLLEGVGHVGKIELTKESHSDQAHTFERAMIQALRLGNLANVERGTSYVESVADERMEALGAFLLHQEYEIIKATKRLETMGKDDVS